MEITEYKPRPIFLSATLGVFGIMAEAMLKVRATVSKAEYDDLRDKVFYSGDPKTALENFFENEVYMALSKPIEQMTKAELEEEWDFVHGDGRKFSDLAHARGAVQALVDKGELMTSEQYTIWRKNLVSKKKEPIPPAPKPQFLDGIVPVAGEGEVAPDPAPKAASKKGRPSAAQDGASGTITGRVTHTPPAKPPIEEVPKEAPAPKGAARSTGALREFLSLDDVGAGDMLGDHVKQLAVSEIAKVAVAHGLDPTKYDAPNPGISKMRLVNSLRAILRKKKDVNIDGITYRIIEEAFEKKAKRR